MERLGRYEIVRPLGRGGMGTVYEAVLLGPGGLRKPVAVKVLHEGADVLRREARIGGLLRHRHLVDVYEVGEDDGRWFCAMELCPGGTLADRAPLPPRAVVEVGLAVCAALRYAHEELGLVHLDIKPENLLLADGEVKLADLGIARAEGFGGDGRIRGTIGYMAPEQARGEQVDARADIYALGITLAELATGMRPAASTTLDWPDSASWDTFEVDEPSVAPIPGTVPDWLAPVVDRCWAERADERWSSMASLADALRTLEVDGAGLREFLGFSAQRTQGGRPRERGRGAELDGFVGRRRELADLAETLSASGIALLKGPAGIGKSRLAAAAADQWVEATERPAWSCDLAAASSLHGLVYAVATALDVAVGRGELDEQVQQLGRALAARGAALLLLDNVDRVADLAPMLRRWRAHAPEARFLVTSRSSVDVGEHVLEVGPMRLADAADLLVARALQRGVDIAGDPAVDELAARLDGVPLALELAAGRLGVLSVRDVLERLGLSLLRSGADDRHGTLRGALDWSWHLLTGAQRSALAQLSVFSGGFTLEAAEGVVEIDGTVLDVVGVLVDRSMVSTLAGGRLGLLSGIQDYAAEKLDDSAGPVLRHGRWFAALGEEPALDALHRTGGIARRSALAAELDNLLAACRRAVDRGDGDVAVGSLLAAWAVMDDRGPFEAAARLAASVTEISTLPALRRAAALRVHATALQRCGRGGEAHAAYETALDLVRRGGDRRAEARLLTDLADLHTQHGRMEEGRAHYEAALAQLGTRDDAITEARVLRNLGNLERERGRIEAARARYEAALTILRRLGDRRSEGNVLANLGLLHSDAGRTADALAEYEAALAIHREVGNRSSEGVVLGYRAVLLARQGQIEEARGAYAAALAILREVGDRRAEAMVLGNYASLHRMERRLDEAGAQLEAVLAIHREVGNPHAEASLLGSLLLLRWEQGRLDEARRIAETALSMHRALGDRRSEGVVLGRLGLLDRTQGRLEEAERSCLAALALHREVGDRRGEAWALANLGGVAYDRGQPERARGWYEAALAIDRDLGNHASEQITLANLGTLHREQGRPKQARACLEAALALHRALKHRHFEGHTLSELAQVQALEGDPDGAEALIAQAESLLRDIGDRAFLAECIAAHAEIRWRAGDVEAARRRLAEAEAEAPAARADVQRMIARVRELVGADPIDRRPRCPSRIDA